MNIAQLIETLYSVLPSPKLTNLEIGVDRVDFDWFGQRYRVTEDLSVAGIDGVLLVSGPRSELVAALLRQARDLDQTLAGEV